MENTIDYTVMSLDELKEDEARIRKELAENIRQQNLLKEILLIEKYGINVGDTVQYQDGKKVVKGVISKVKTSYSLAYYFVGLFNSNGQVGKRETQILNPKKLQRIE